MKKLVLLALVATVGITAGCCANPCQPQPCNPCQPVYQSPCCPAPSGSVTGAWGAGGSAPAPTMAAPAPAPAGGAACGAACGGK